MISSSARRWALLLVASALAAGPVIVAPPARADGTFSCSSGQACVHITFPDGGHAPVDVPASFIADEGDLAQVEYPVRYASGTVNSDTITGVTLRTLLASLDPAVSPDSVVSTLARNPRTGYQSPLHAGDLGDSTSAPPFDNGLEPAFGLYGTGVNTEIEYIRPQRDPSDVNGEDRFIAGSGDPVIDLQVRTSGAVVHPSITVGKGPFTVGKAVPFTASFPMSDPPHSGASYSWTFAAGDPPVPGPASTTQRYTSNNTFSVSVSVSGDDPGIGQFYGQSKTVTVQVGPKTPTKPTNGPTGGTGKDNRHDPAHGPTKASGHHEGSSPKGGPHLDVPTAAPTTGIATPGSTGNATATTTGSSAAGPTSSTHRTPGPRNGAGSFVQGVLIDGETAPALPDPATAATRAAASARRPARVSSSFDARWLWVLAPVLLLIAGALGERRRAPGRHGPQSGS